MITCTCYHSTGAQAIRPWAEQISAEQDAKIREAFPSKKPINEEPLTLPKGTAPSVPVKPSPVVIETGPVMPYHTGYARIDNAITDALKGKDQELKDNVYQIIRKDLLPHNVHGLEEADRLAQIGLGVEKAQYLADHFMDDKTKTSFMKAIDSIARIAAKGTRVGSCEMEYQVKHVIQIDGDGYVHENQMDSFLFSMEKESPKDFETYQKLKMEAEGDNIEAELFALKWAMKNLKLIAGNRADYEKHQKEQYDKLQEVELDRTFAGADTSSKERFLTSLRERLQTNQSLQLRLFLDQIDKMTKTPGEYLFRSKQVLYARA